MGTRVEVNILEYGEVVNSLTAFAGEGDMFFHKPGRIEKTDPQTGASFSLGVEDETNVRDELTPGGSTLIIWRSKNGEPSSYDNTYFSLNQQTNSEVYNNPVVTLGKKSHPFQIRSVTVYRGKTPPVE